MSLRVECSIKLYFRHQLDITMWCNGCSDEKPRFRVKTGFIKEVGRLLKDDIWRVLAGIADRWVSIASHPGIIVLICERIQDKVRFVQPLNIWAVIVVDCMRIVKLSYIVGVVASSLQPCRKKVFVDSFFNNFLVTSYKMVSLTLNFVSITHHRAERGQ